MSSDLIINSVILPDDIDDIKIGDEFNIRWEIINIDNKQRKNILLKAGFTWWDEKLEQHKYCWKPELIAYKQTDRLKRFEVVRSYTKESDNFDIQSKLYEETWLGFIIESFNKLKWECPTRHRVNKDRGKEEK